jgi:capsular exopolysaccharide synthesis family protein
MKLGTAKMNTPPRKPTFPAINGSRNLIGRGPGQTTPQGPAESAGAGMRNFLKLLRRRWPILLVCALIVPAAALIWSLQQEKEYSSTASILFRSNTLVESLTGSTYFSSSSEAAREAQTNVQLVSLGDASARTAKKLAIPGVTAAVVAGSIEVSLQGESEIADVTATIGDPVLAQEIANTFAHEYIATRRDTDRQAVSEAQRRLELQFENMSPEQVESARGERLANQIEELETAASLQTGNAEVVQNATINTSPVSPHTKRNVALGLVVGVLLGIGLILLLEQLDTRIKDVEEVEAAYELPILARIPHGKPTKPDATNPVGLDTRAIESFRMLHANLRYFNVGRDLNTLMITSAVPGEGKTTVSWGLAVTECKAGRSVLLIEADMRQPSLIERIGGDPNKGLSQVLSGAQTLDAGIQKIQVGSKKRLDVLLSGPIPPNSSSLLESERMTELLEEAQDRYDLVVIDSPPVVVSDPIALMPQVSGLLVVARLGRSRKDAARYLNELLANPEVFSLGAVANDAAPAREGYYMPKAGIGAAI